MLKAYCVVMRNQGIGNSSIFLDGHDGKVQNLTGKFLDSLDVSILSWEQASNSAWPENSFANVFPNSTAARLSSSSAKALHVADKGARFAQNLEFL